MDQFKLDESKKVQENLNKKSKDQKNIITKLEADNENLKQHLKSLSDKEKNKLKEYKQYINDYQLLKQNFDKISKINSDLQQALKKKSEPEASIKSREKKVMEQEKKLKEWEDKLKKEKKKKLDNKRKLMKQRERKSGDYSVKTVETEETNMIVNFTKYANRIPVFRDYWPVMVGMLLFLLFLSIASSGR